MTLAGLIPLLIAAIVLVIVVVIIETLLQPESRVLKLIRLLAVVIFLVIVLRHLGYA